MRGVRQFVLALPGKVAFEGEGYPRGRAFVHSTAAKLWLTNGNYAPIIIMSYSLLPSFAPQE